jgi:CheY-like chemotaxis protein
MATILILDDDSVSRSLTAIFLSDAGHQIMEADDGDEALAMARANAPDIVITDLFLPTTNGFEFVRQLRQISALAEIPVIFLTGTDYLDADARTLARACRVSRVLTKPAKPEQILDAVNECLGGGREAR